MRKVILVTISLHQMAGGLERNIVRIANYFSSLGDEVHLVTFDRQPATSFFAIGQNVVWHKVGRTQPHSKIGFMERIRLIGRLRGILGRDGKKDVFVIGFHHGILFRLWVASFFKKIHLICSERNSLSLYEHIGLKKWNFNFLMLYVTSKIVVQFEGYKKDYPEPLRPRITAIPNVVESATSRAAPETPARNQRFVVLAVGRLCDQKNFACLIHAFATLAGKYPSWDLVIIGNGHLRPELQNLIDSLDLQNRVSLPGAMTNMEDWYASAHIFCMPSKWEGFPNALAEALACGLPALGFSGCAGVRDLISHELNGLLADGSGDVGALAGQLEILMGNPSARTRMGKAAVISMGQYLPENVYPMWDRLLTEISN